MTGENLQDLEKKTAGTAAANLVEDGMILGLGTGSTVTHFLNALGHKVAVGMTVCGVPTSERTAAHCRDLGIELLDFASITRLDMAVDGADEIDHNFQMIKGGGGALLREKVVASAADQVVIIVDSGKRVPVLGAFALPVEIVQFGYQQTERRLAGLGIDFTLRQAGDAPFITDNGNFILDCAMATIDDPAALHGQLKSITGVVDTGLFIDLCHVLILGEGEKPVIYTKA